MLLEFVLATVGIRSTKKREEAPNEREKKHLRFGDPGDLGCKSFNMVFLPLENLCGHKHGEVAVLHAQALDSFVKVLLHLLPNGV